MEDEDGFYWEAVHEIQQLIEAQNSDLDSTIDEIEKVIINLQGKLTQEQISNLFKIQISNLFKIPKRLLRRR